MADDKSIDELERDVELARARVAADLALLRAPETYEAAKSGVVEAALGYRDQQVDGWIETLRAKASANPLAVAAIGAGVAWRLYKHPPIATVLVGAGLASLMRTDPDDDSMHPRRLLAAASHRAVEMKDRAAAQIAELTETATGAIEDKAREWSGAAESAYEHAAERVASVVSGAAPNLTQAQADMRIRPGGDGALWDADHGYDNGRAERRDMYLLGVAALAVGAAFGLSRLRRDHIEHELEYDDGTRTSWRRL